MVNDALSHREIDRARALLRRGFAPHSLGPAMRRELRLGRFFGEGCAYQLEPARGCPQAASSLARGRSKPALP